MKTIMLIFHFAVCIFEIWMLRELFSVFLGEKLCKGKNRVIAFAAFSIIVFFINSFDNTILNFIFVPIVYFIMSVLLFRGNVLKKIFAVLIGTSIFFGAELIAVSALSITSKELVQNSMINEPSAIFLTIIIKMITFIVVVIIKQLIPKRNGDMDFVTFLLFMIVSLSGLGIMFSVVFCDINFKQGSLAKYMLILFCFLLMIGDVSIFYGYIRYAKLLTEKENNRKVLFKQQMQLDNYKSIDMANNKYLKLLHDANYHIKTVYGLLLKDNRDEAVAMLEELTDQYGNIQFVEYSNNAILNVILSDYRERTEKEHIEFDIFVEQGFNINYVDEIDIVAMLGNLLSNAYEATKKVDNKKIKVQMFMQNNGSFSVIKIQNSFDGIIEGGEEELRTTKADKQQHGFGIKNVQEAAEKYNGWISETWADCIFKTVLVLENNCE